MDDSLSHYNGARCDEWSAPAATARWRASQQRCGQGQAPENHSELFGKICVDKYNNTSIIYLVSARRL